MCFLHFLFVSHTQYSFSTSLSQAFLRCVVLCERVFLIPIILIFLAFAFPCRLLVPFVSPVIFFVFFSPALWFPPLTQSIFHFGLSTYSCSCFLSMYWVSNFCFWPGLQQQQQQQQQQQTFVRNLWLLLVYYFSCQVGQGLHQTNGGEGGFRDLQYPSMMLCMYGRMYPDHWLPGCVPLFVSAVSASTFRDLWPFLPCVLTCLFFDRSFWSGSLPDPQCFVWASFSWRYGDGAGTVKKNERNRTTSSRLTIDFWHPIACFASWFALLSCAPPWWSIASSRSANSVQSARTVRSSPFFLSR